MPNSVAKGRSRIALLAVLAVVASLFVLPAAPASAATGDVENPADWSACVGDAMTDAGFGDVAGSFAGDAIDCIAYYGITTGTSATTYSPAQAVTRWQMALFLVRAAGPAGISVPAASDQGFTDISGLPAATQDAINQLAALGISKGTTATTFSPMDAVSRYQMALFLIRFLDEAGIDFDGDFASGFSDTGSVSFEAYNAIEDAYDFGITTGTTATTYSPYAAVTREQMAAFIARTLNHTNARPAGLSFQVLDATLTEGDSADFQVSVRDASFQPVADALVDVFDIATADVADALAADGTCTADVSATVGGIECTIELGEAVATDSDGNDEFSSAALTEGTTFWAWTGDPGDEFDADTTDVVALAVTVAAAPTQWLVTTTIPKYADTLDGGNLVKYGTTVTHTFQLADVDGDAVALAGKTVKLRLDTEVNGDLTEVTTVSAKSDANGMVSFSLTQADPDTTDSNDETSVFVTPVDISGYALNLSKVPNADPDVTWDDDASEETTLVAASNNDYVVASDSGTGATNVVTGTLYDQYGLGMSGKTVSFTSDDSDGVGGTPINRTTNSAGVATLGYSRDSAASGLEQVTANNGVAGSDGPVNVYWVIEEADGASNAGSAILVGDADNDTIVTNNGADYVYVEYDSNDQFNIGGATTYTDFDEALADGDIDWIVYTYQDTASQVSQFTGSLD